MILSHVTNVSIPLRTWMDFLDFVMSEYKSLDCSCCGNHFGYEHRKFSENKICASKCLSAIMFTVDQETEPNIQKSPEQEIKPEPERSSILSSNVSANDGDVDDVYNPVPFHSLKIDYALNHGNPECFPVENRVTQLAYEDDICVDPIFHSVNDHVENCQLPRDTLNKSDGDLIYLDPPTKLLLPLGLHSQILALFERKSVYLPTKDALSAPSLEALGSVFLSKDENQILNELLPKYASAEPVQNSTATNRQLSSPVSLAESEAGFELEPKELFISDPDPVPPELISVDEKNSENDNPVLIRKSVHDLKYSENLFRMTDDEIIINCTWNDGLVCISSRQDKGLKDCLAESIAQYVKNAPGMLRVPDVDEIVIAPYYGFHYRGKVFAVSGETVWLTFVDYGDETHANFTELKELSSEIGQHPIYGVVCQTKERWGDNDIEGVSIDIEDVHAALESRGKTVENAEKCETGLKNLGNSCYINSIMQCMNHTVALVAHFKNCRTEEILSTQIGKCFAKMNKGRPHVCIYNLKSALVKLNTIFGSYQQYDSHEFLTWLLERIHDEMNESAVVNGDSDLRKSDDDELCDEEAADLAWISYLSMNDTIITQLFCGQQKSSVRCLKCLKSSTTFETFFALSVPIPDKPSDKCTIENCLELYTAEEEIPDYSCDGCKSKVRAIKKIDIWRLPRILIIHFQRFYVDTWNEWHKRCTKVEFNKKSFIPTCSMKNVRMSYDPATYEYELYGVSNHYGCMESGHYTAYCRTNKNWTEFDDTTVWEISAQDVCSSAAYILFYCRVDKP